MTSSLRGKKRRRSVGLKRRCGRRTCSSCRLNARAERSASTATRATVVLDAAIHSDEGGDAQIERESVPLVRQNDNWCMALTTLESLMIRD